MLSGDLFSLEQMMGRPDFSSFTQSYHSDIKLPIIASAIIFCFCIMKMTFVAGAGHFFVPIMNIAHSSFEYSLY